VRELQFPRHVLGYHVFVSRRREQGKGAARAKAVQVVNHQRDRLALFLDAAPGHQLSKCLPRAGQAVQPDLLFAAAFAERSALLLAMAYLFNSAGRQVQPGLSFALLESEPPHAAIFSDAKLSRCELWWQFGFGWCLIRG